MFPYSQSVTPAVRSHLDAQVSFLNDMSKSLFNSFQQLCNLNIQLTQTLLEETALSSQQMLTADRQTDVISAAASRAQPATEKLRAYQQHISRVAADAQVELARVTEQHVQETTRTARALADEVARVASEETERSMRNQQESMRKFSDPFTQHAGAWRGNGSTEVRGSTSMQSGQSGNAQGGSAGSSQSDQHASMQGNSTGAPSAGQAGGGTSGKTGSVGASKNT
ncbi:TIGR01841 family phasin [Massilia antarctica]|uniref:TIGR01841 family phasin n=1 Tax=Massilia antarctica TaxID=2765360 RepID=UPI0006BB556A|nr:TIGR01841 family phasin [Massilia sp. H27-R4]MCY0913903.1 TIGR01841 family phasin [Massilia sp. H27-R4]CUI04364.1 granule-associated protein [Janthinobacterium sp. CG23_2]CUU28150.1 granule-associated protein [Janthinobacterium sp. CG23_2]